MARQAGAEKIALPKMAELVAERIRAQIARGDFKLGDSLPSETELMEQFGVARPTMREAIRILESESLITTRRGSQSGPKVREIDVSVLGRRAGMILQVNGATWDDLFEAQSALEPKAAALAAKRRTKADLAALREVVDRIREVDDLLDFAPLAAEFHLTLVRASKNQTLTMLTEILQSLSVSFTREHLVSIQPVRDRVRSGSIDLYEQVIERLEARDADGVEELWGNGRAALRASIERSARDRNIAIYDR